MISRRNLLTGAAAAAGEQLRPQSAGRPNVVIILMDDLGCHDLGCQGAADLRTPNIDALAESGAIFTNWYSNAPLCAPARASLMTGRYPIRAGVPVNGRSLPPGEKTIAALLKDAGYKTALTGKWHLGSDAGAVPNAHGFDYFYGFHEGCVDYYSHRYYWGEPKRVNFHDLWRNREEIFEDGRYLTERIGEEAVQFIESAGAQPFFLYCPFNAPHYPMHAPRKYVELFPALDHERRIYAAMIAAADEGMGQILHALDRLGKREHTLIFFAGDNGATRETRAGLNQRPPTAGSNAPYRGFKFSLFDGGMHVPAAMSWPAVIPARQTIHEIGMTMDILPTVCLAAGATLPADRTIDGRDILPVAAARAPSPHDTIYWASGEQLAARRGKWKLVLQGMDYDGTPAGEKPLQGDDATFLSDLEENRGESRNLRHQHPDIADALATEAHRWLESVKQY
ncbi:MAG TPA: sulfatase-like hydrolase/transferase [Bryobacteraceae bacterium]|nr:sulfatase-like hydrolase/transferase [Bryobacteraceae bacterium]